MLCTIEKVKILSKYDNLLLHLNFKYIKIEKVLLEINEI